MEAIGLHGIRYVLFDAVGTLMYADPPVASVYQAVGRRYGSRLTVDEIRSRFRTALAAEHRLHEPTNEIAERERWRRIVARTLCDVAEDDDSVFAELWNHFAQPQSWRIYDEVAAVWHKLLARGYPPGIASNFDQRLRSVIAGHALLARCPAVFISAEIGFLKPDVRFFRAIECTLNLPPGEIALVGDDEIADVQGATAAGWRAIRLDRESRRGGNGTIQTLTDLLRE
jgi:putative hydrolase of the HAD superfamily